MTSGPGTRRVGTVVSASAALVVLALASSTRMPGLVARVTNSGRFDFPWTGALDNGAQIPPSLGPSALPSVAPSSPAWAAALGYVLVALLIAAGIGLVAAIIIQTIRSIRARSLPGSASEPSGESVDLTASHVQDTLRDSLARLRHGDDAASTIIECWRRLEQVGAESGTTRTPNQTAEEFTLDLLGASTDLSESDLRALADLYRAAMFASVPPGEDGRREAIAVLERLELTLRAGTLTTQLREVHDDH